MSPIFKNYGAVMISLVVAIAIILAAIIWKDTKYENAWLYITGLSPILMAAFELYSKKK